MANLAKLVVQLEAQSSKLTSELEKSNRRAQKWEQKVKKNVTNVKGAFAALGIGIAAVKFKSFVTESIAAADQIAKMSDALGLTTKAFQEYSFGAELSGVNTSQFTSNMTAFVKRVGEARSETGPLVSFLKKYDEELLIAIQRTKSQEQALGLIADAVKNAATETDRAAIANAAFSRAGVTMVNFLKDGSAGLTDFSDKAQELGLVIDEAMLRKSEDANDKLTILSKTLRIQGVNAVVEYAGEIQTLAMNLLNFSKTVARVPDFIRYLSESFAAAVHGPADPVRIADRIDVLKKKLFELQIEEFKYKEQGGIAGGAKRLLFLDDYEARIKTVKDELQKLTQAQELFLAAPAPIELPKPVKPPQREDVDGGRLTTGEQQLQRQVEALELSLLTEEQKIAESQERRTFMVENAFENELIGYERRAELLSDIDKKAADERVAIEQRASAQMLSIRASTANAAIGFLQLFADKNKAIAKGIIIVQKGLAIAQAIQNTAIAVTSMLKYPPGIREGLIAETKLLGKVQVGLIAATGLAQLGGAGGGGGGGGSPSIGAGGGGVSIDNDLTTPEQQAPGQTTIIFVGSDRPSDEFVDHTIASLGERINEGSLVVIRRDSPQAQEIALAAGSL
jgi:hypothetical protein